MLAAFATLSLGVVLGPEAPLIALGGGLGVLAVKLVKRDAPARTQAAVAAAGSFAAISTLLGSPLTGAFLLMEASGLGGAMMQVVLIPGLLAAGVGSLVFVGLDAWTGLGTFSLAIPGLPHVGAPTFGEFGWALAIGVLAVPFGMGIRWLGPVPAALCRAADGAPHPAGRPGCRGPGHRVRRRHRERLVRGAVLRAVRSRPVRGHAASYTVGALVLLLVCKGIAYGVSLSSFRGGPTFPALFLGAAGGVALSHLPGLPLVDGVAMGIAAMSVVMLRLPLTSVLLASLLLASDGLAVMPLVIVAVVVAYVLSARLTPSPAAAAPAATGPPAGAGPALPPPAAPRPPRPPRPARRPLGPAPAAPARSADRPAKSPPS